MLVQVGHILQAGQVPTVVVKVVLFIRLANIVVVEVDAPVVRGVVTSSIPIQVMKIPVRVVMAQANVALVEEQVGYNTIIKNLRRRQLF